MRGLTRAKLVFFRTLVHGGNELNGGAAPLRTRRGGPANSTGRNCAAGPLGSILHSAKGACPCGFQRFRANGWATTAELSAELRGSVAIPVILEDRNLGARLSYSARRAKTTLDTKLSECLRLCERIQHLPLGLEVRATLVGCFVVTKALYACSATPPSHRALRQLRAACTRAVWGQANPWRAPEVVYSLLCRGHLSDPRSAFAYSTHLVARRVLRRRPELKEKFAAVLALRQESPSTTVGGPVAALLRAQRIANTEFGDDSFEDLHHLNEKDPGELMTCHWLSPQCSTAHFQHMLRESIRLEAWSELGHRRPSFEGVSDGVNRAATLELHRMLGGLDRYRLRCILTGGIPTALNRSRRSKDVDPLCPCCGEDIESTAHLFDDCPTLGHIRYLDLRPAQWHALPPCLRLHGIVPARWGSLEDCKVVACEVQHALLDMWQHRCSFVPEPGPLPRWR